MSRQAPPSYSLVLALCMAAACGEHANVTKELPALTVVGKQVVERESQRPVVLRGVTFTSGVWFGDATQSATPPTLDALSFMQTEADFARVQAWGATAVTLYLDWYWFQSPEGWHWLDQALDWCRAHHLYVVPSVVVYPVGGQRGGTAFWASTAAQAELRSFWVELVERYQGRTEIAGIDITNEPQGTDANTIRAYQTTVIDAVRAVSPEVVVFIEPLWGLANELAFIDRPGLVYDVHYYEPYYFTGGGMPWIWSSTAPVGVHYPGDMIASLEPLQTNGYGYTAAPAGTYDWTRLHTSTVTIADDAEFAFVRISSNNDSTASLWVDDVEVSVDGGDFTSVKNGSAEEVATYGDPLYWVPYRARGGTLTRVADHSHAGAYSARLSSCDGWCQYTLGGDAYNAGTLGSIAVVSGQTVVASAWARAENAQAGKHGIDFLLARARRVYWDRHAVASSIDSLLVSFSESHNVPLFVGELTPSLLNPRPDIVTYASDVLDTLNDHGIGWTFYLYRDLYPSAQERVMGIYNGAFGLPTESCIEDTEMLDAVKSRLVAPQQ